MTSSQLSGNEIHKIEFKHRWLIKDFANLLSDTSSSFIFSKPFPPKNKEFQFSLRLQPNYIDKKQDSYVSIYLYLEECKRSEALKPFFQISILKDLNDETDGFNVKEKTENFKVENLFGFSCFISEKSVREFLLSTENILAILCNITIESTEIFSIETPISLSVLEAPKNVTKFTHKWTVNGFSAFYYDNIDQNQAIVYPKLDYAFPTENKDLKFNLVLILNQNEEQTTQEVQKYISLYLYFESETIEEVMVSYRLAILDWKNRFYVSGEGYNKFTSKGDEKGQINFISCDELLDLRKGLLPKDTLTIFAQIEMFDLHTTMKETKNKSPKIDSTLDKLMKQEQNEKNNFLCTEPNFLSCFTERDDIDDFYDFDAVKAENNEYNPSIIEDQLDDLQMSISRLIPNNSSLLIERTKLLEKIDSNNAKNDVVFANSASGKASIHSTNNVKVKNIVNNIVNTSDNQNVIISHKIDQSGLEFIIDNLDAKIKSNIDNNLHGQSSFDGIHDKLDNILKQLSRTDSKISGIEKQISDTENKVYANKEEIKKINFMIGNEMKKVNE